MTETLCFEVFRQCVQAVHDGELIESASARDKEFHFQDWFQARLRSLDVHFEAGGRNAFPDFKIVAYPEGCEVKGLAWPGRVRNYDPTARYPRAPTTGEPFFYVFGRYPAQRESYAVGEGEPWQYPVVDLVICHGDFLNADHAYVHKNQSVKGFGTYGDILIRDRKMYVAPAPFALTTGTTGLMTLIVPVAMTTPDDFVDVGFLTGTEAPELVVAYRFDLRTNQPVGERVGRSAYQWRVMEVQGGRGRGRMAVGNRGQAALQAPGVPVADGTHWEERGFPPAGCPRGPADPFRLRRVRALRRARYDRLVDIAALCGCVWGDARQRCRGLSTAQQSSCGLRNAGMAEGCDWQGLPAVLGRAALLDAPGDIRKAIRTRGDGAERNRRDGAPFPHRQMRRQWKDGQSHATNRIGLEPGACTVQVRHGRAWVHMQGLERGPRIAIPRREKHPPTGTLRIILQDNGQVEIYHAVNADTVCSTKPCGDGTVGVDKGHPEAFTDSDGKRRGEGLGEGPATESDDRKVKGQRRNRLRTLGQKHREAGNAKKADRIRRRHLGNRKWDRHQKQNNVRVRDRLCRAAHGIVDRAGTIACEGRPPCNPPSTAARTPAAV